MRFNEEMYKMMCRKYKTNDYSIFLAAANFDALEKNVYILLMFV